MTTVTLPSSTPGDHVCIFEAFLAKRSNDPYDPLSVAAARPYRSIWLSWCKHLATSRNDEITSSWAHAQPLDLFHYLYKGGISPAGNRRTSLSEISRWRYWSVINSIYEFAKNSGQVMRNPAEGMAMDDRPLLLQSEGQIFNVRDWKAIEAALPVGDSPTAIRDRALMMLIMDAALTTTEVTKLRIHDCTYTSNGFAVQITGSRGAQDRVLILAKETSEALSTWLGTRTKIQAHGIFADALFTTQKRGPIRPSGVYHIVDKPYGQLLQMAKQCQLIQAPSDSETLGSCNGRTQVFLSMKLHEGLDLRMNAHSVGLQGISEHPTKDRHLDRSKPPKKAPATSHSADTLVMICASPSLDRSKPTSIAKSFRDIAKLAQLLGSRQDWLFTRLSTM